ncbi:MAG: twin-arginine translocase subunit TatC [Verrucomicrobia bacterium]|nr:twin-arginine translocase subunit TatC [Kiritimatiellia bacterium]MCP5488430.1 twin-arginine translocase subunit TatC [Verrucomicrobiota bacterium]
MKRFLNPPSEAEATKPFLDHLEDLRTMLLRSVVAIAAGMAIAFPLTPFWLKVLRRPLYAVTDTPEAFLQSIQVSGAFVAAMRISFWTGLLLASPALVVIAAMFFLPALKPHEKVLLYRGAAAGAVLFAFGLSLGYFYTLPFALSAMYVMNDWLGVIPIWTVDSYVAFSTRLLIAFGLAFELPLVLLFLGKIGVIDARWMRDHRRHAVVAALILACVLTPPDVVSQVIMSIPLILLFEVCIWIMSTWNQDKNERGATE